MIIALGQDQRRTRIANRIDDVLADSPRSHLVVDQLLEQGLKFDALVRSRGFSTAGMLWVERAQNGRTGETPPVRGHLPDAGLDRTA
jgi:hypothetical protein